ncbi:MAG: glycosyltransferase [Candidatus Ancillula sp.]|jgi:glycosyltransferase involved in cell wall biosynthesis|nr:glycosyltransferase [Candidatus Ancillula sp.]
MGKKKINNADIAIAVVTFKRQQMLQDLLNSYLNLTVFPKFIVIVDNENSAETAKIVNNFKEEISKENVEVVYKPMEENTGGSGGFAKGAEIAYHSGAAWLWLMDDDVLVYPDSIKRIEPILENSLEKDRRVVQPRRHNWDNSPFYWQYQFMVGLGIPNPIAPSDFGETEEFKVMNTACFEGGFFHRSIVQEIGLPDARFFIYWDDTLYGYLASKITTPILIRDFLMKRAREISHIPLGRVRKLNSTSDMVRYYIMRNRGYLAKYFMINGDYHRFLFGFGTALTFVKETIRLFIDHKFRKGLKAIWKGWRDSRKILHDKDWKPVGPILSDI